MIAPFFSRGICRFMTMKIGMTNRVTSVVMSKAATTCQRWNCAAISVHGKTGKGVCHTTPGHCVLMKIQGWERSQRRATTKIDTTAEMAENANSSFEKSTWRLLGDRRRKRKAMENFVM
jgi:hypothetical protein